MTLIEIMNFLDSEGHLQKMYKGGLISARIIQFREMYLQVDLKMRVHDKSQRVAVEETADMMKVSTDTVYKALRTFEFKPNV